MGEEVTGYFGRLVPALQTAYGVAWNIEARGESPAIDDRAWQVQVGYSDFQPQLNGALGLQMTMKCAATISYVGKGPTHNSGLQAADIAVTLAAWIAGYTDTDLLAFSLTILRSKWSRWSASGSMFVRIPGDIMATYGGMFR